MLNIFAANSLYRSKTALGAFFRRMRAKLGAPKAITATAHKLARLIYNMLKYDTEYIDKGQNHYEQRYKEQIQGSSHITDSFDKFNEFCRYIFLKLRVIINRSLNTR